MACAGAGTQGEHYRRDAKVRVDHPRDGARPPNAPRLRCAAPPWGRTTWKKRAQLYVGAQWEFCQGRAAQLQPLVRRPSAISVRATNSPCSDRRLWDGRLGKVIPREHIARPHLVAHSPQEYRRPRVAQTPRELQGVRRWIWLPVCLHCMLVIIRHVHVGFQFQLRKDRRLKAEPGKHMVR